jgi:hypothetical protein
MAEIRRPKPEIRTKPEIRYPNQPPRQKVASPSETAFFGLQSSDFPGAEQVIMLQPVPPIGGFAAPRPAVDLVPGKHACKA